MPTEIRLQSLDSSRPNDKLWREIESKQGELLAFLKGDKKDNDPDVSTLVIKPLAGFPTGLETFVIVIAVTFATGVAKGFAGAAGKEVGKAAGAAVGRKLGAKIRKWIEANFPDVAVSEVVEK